MSSRIFALGALLSLVLLLATQPQKADAWGAIGHSLIGHVAREYMHTRAQDAVYELLIAGQDNLTDATFENVSNWADKYRATPEGKPTAGWHFVDPLDDPIGHKCSYNYIRDCPDSNCVTGMVANFTSQLSRRNADQYTTAERAKALKFVFHLTEDMHQPLHVSGYKLGGNQINVTLDGQLWNLHASWDTGMIVKHIAENYRNSTDYYYDSVLERLSNEWRDRIPEWTACARNHIQPPYGRLNPRFCPDQWAQETNALVCEYVYVGDLDNPNKTNVEIGGDYYNRVKDVIDVQLAKAAVRLAASLNAIL
ncbi:hypothetical protein RI367_003207 [Sorochytrium milnesiophthora]